MPTSWIEPIPRVAVDSSAISSIGYDPAREILAVQLRTGHVYHYIGVPPAVHAELLASKSKGAFFGKQVVKYEHVRTTGWCEHCGTIGPLGDVCVDCGCGRHTFDRPQAPA